MNTTSDSLAEVLRRRRFGLVLSAGYFGFFGHAGLIAALEGAGLRPAGFAGTSAGALVASLAAAGLSADEIARRLAEVRRGDFWDPAPLSTLLALVRGRGVTGWLRGERLRARLTEVLPVQRIEQCEAPLVIVTTDVGRGSARVHVSGPLAEAIHASCAYPGLFRTVQVEGASLWDGGLVDKAPLVALADRLELDALLVHALPSASRSPEKLAEVPGYLAAMARGLAAVRHEHYVLQTRLCEARGIEVFELAPELPRLSSRRLSRGPDVLALACAQAARGLAAPAAQSRSHRGGS